MRKEMILGMVKFLSTENKNETSPEVRSQSLQTCTTLWLLPHFFELVVKQMKISSLAEDSPAAFSFFLPIVACLTLLCPLKKRRNSFPNLFWS